jgi:hypothetical protein
MTRAAPGWRPDPTGSHRYRYWDGEQWTDRVTNSAVASTTRNPTYTDSDASTTEAVAPAAGPSPDEAQLPSEPPGDRHPLSARIIRKQLSMPKLTAIGAAAAVLVAAIVVSVLGENDGTGGADRNDEPPGDSTETTEQAPTLRPGELGEVMQSVARRLETAGTYTFDAEITVRLTGVVSGIHQLDRRGEVRLPDSMRQRGQSIEYSGRGTEERIAIGDQSWRRRSAFPEFPDAIPWIPEEQLPEPFPLPNDQVGVRAVGDVPGTFDARLIPQWLAAATAHEDAGAQEGHRVVAALLPCTNMPQVGDCEDVRDGAVELTIDENREPVSVALSATFGTAEFAASYELDAIGDPVTIAAPRSTRLDPAPRVQDEDLAVAAASVTPIGLTSPPDGWQLTRADVVSFPLELKRRCATHVNVAYTGPSSAWLTISATSARCGRLLEGARITAGDHVGTTVGPADQPQNPFDVTFASFEIAGMDVHVSASDVPNLDDVLAGLGPVDPSQQAERAEQSA